ncbi:hypothetical protein HELRODRAFT_160520 [Helobdella robusta]|uniref:Protein kinase domain-containing protein n=1 Tax=Helobdella robusta TaxID=6412 RepID=T1EQC7_HELRO|nr:hypothetical protein HELRODRAFT_160520 [Helobdella robusta]ESO06353.1 hypothetical protein HELRODRAFT_160520 [Helobdella robusta]
MINVEAEENKCVLKIKTKSPLTIEIIEKEIYILKTISKAGKTSFIVNILDCFQTPGHGVIVMENVNCISLQRHLFWDEYFDEYRAMFYTASIMMALHHLHALKITHGLINLKLQSVVLNSDGYPKLMDFSYSQMVNEDNCFDCFANDFVQLGRCLFEMLTGDKLIMIPLKGRDQYLTKNSQACVEFLKEVTSSVQLKDKLINTNNSSNNDLAAGFLTHDFFKLIKWSNLLDKIMPAPEFSPIEIKKSKKLSNVWSEIKCAEENTKLIDDMDFQELKVLNCWKHKIV